MIIAKIHNKEFIWQHANIAIDLLKKFEGQFVMVDIKNVIRKRTLAQNRLIHSIVSDLANQIDYPEGSGVYRTKEAWKDLIAAAIKVDSGGLEVVPIPESDQVVVLGLHTSAMSTQEMSIFIEYAHSYGTKRGVQWSETSG